MISTIGPTKFSHEFLFVIVIVGLGGGGGFGGGVNSEK